MKEVYIFPLDNSIVWLAPILSIVLIASCEKRFSNNLFTIGFIPAQTLLPISPGVNAGLPDSQQKPIRG